MNKIPLLIFDSYAGLCNQMYDIHCAVNFCNMHNLRFTFRYASLRNPNNLSMWYNIDFNQLFDDQFLLSNPLFVEYNTLECNSENTFNYYNSDIAIDVFKSLSLIRQATTDNSDPSLTGTDNNNNNNDNDDLISQLYYCNKPYIVLKQFWSVHAFRQIKQNIFNVLQPCNKLMQRYNAIKTEILPEKYNLIHYRYEIDFTNYFKITHIDKLCDLIKNIPFKDKSLKIYVAASNILHLPDTHISQPISSYPNVLYKKDYHSTDLNFEENAFIDFMIGRDASEIYGHNKSAFSSLLNIYHNTDHYYNCR